MSNTQLVRPAIVTDEHLQYLDALRASGQTNMFGATPWLQDEFSLDAREARAILVYWMNSFGQEGR